MLLSCFILMIKNVTAHQQGEGTIKHKREIGSANEVEGNPIEQVLILTGMKGALRWYKLEVDRITYKRARGQKLCENGKVGSIR